VDLAEAVLARALPPLPPFPADENPTLVTPGSVLPPGDFIAELQGIQRESEVLAAHSFSERCAPLRLLPGAHGRGCGTPSTTLPRSLSSWTGSF
jgi:hypothetical protein